MNLSWLLGSRPATPPGRSALAARRGEVPAAYEHLCHLQTLADRHGDRAAGTSGYEAAARYVEQQLASAGYRSTRQYFTVKDGGRQISTFNVIAETDSGRDDRVIMLGAHLDGVPGTAAINDNGSGVAALLETATSIARLGQTEHTVRFAWWGAEEFDTSYGSRHYVKDLAKNNPDALGNILCYLNVDMIASPNPIIAVYDARDTDHELKIPEGSTQLMDVLTDYFDSRHQPWTTTDWDFDSDQVAFAKKGVAAGGLYTGDDEKKSRSEALMFGGEAKKKCDPHYHQPGDDLSNVNLAALALMTDALTHAAVRLAGTQPIRTQS